MKYGWAVIGANFGDEGKGLITDYLCSAFPEDTAVVRYNGGAQAGHTVVLPDGRRHVFSHFGAGSFLGCPTYLSKFFVCNPGLFVKEYRELESKGVEPKVFIHPRSIVSTPFDVMFNRLSEQKRKEGRHGSCGVGISESIIRTAAGYGLYAEDFRSILTVSNKLWLIKEEWLPQRWEELRLDSDKIGLECIDTDKMTEEYMSDCRRFLKRFQIEAGPPKEKRIVFEGAQGLALDECRIDQFPHTTHSRTGLPNVIHLCRTWGIESLDPIYVTRTYVTRHGAGPLEHAVSTQTAEIWGWACKTNIDNVWQGSLRYAVLDREALMENIYSDYSSIPAGMLGLPYVAFTHCDITAPPKFIGEWGYFSYGPTRESVILEEKVVDTAKSLRVE